VRDHYIALNRTLWDETADSYEEEHGETLARHDGMAWGCWRHYASCPIPPRSRAKTYWTCLAVPHAGRSDWLSWACAPLAWTSAGSNCAMRAA